MRDHNILHIRYHHALKRLLLSIYKFLFRLLHIFLRMECTAGYQVLVDRADLINSTYHFLGSWLGRCCKFHRDASTIRGIYIHCQLQLIQYHCKEYNHLIHIAHQRHKWLVYKCHWLYDNFHIDSHIDLLHIQYFEDRKHSQNSFGRRWQRASIAWRRYWAHFNFKIVR